MKISSNIIKAVVKIWETYPEPYFNLMFIRRPGGLFDGEIEIMSTTSYVMYKAAIVPPYGTLEDSGLEEIVINIPDLVQFVGREETIDMEVKPDGLVLNGKLIPAHKSLVGYRNTLRTVWAEYVVTAERRATVQPVDDLLSAYEKVYKSFSSYRKRKLKEKSERLTIGFNLHSGEQFAFHEIPYDDDGDFFVKKSWQLNTTNLDTSHMQDFDTPMRYFDYMYLKPVFESALGEFIELHFHRDYKKGLVCVSEGRIDGIYQQAAALIMPISYIKFEEVKNE